MPPSASAEAGKPRASRRFAREKLGLIPRRDPVATLKKVDRAAAGISLNHPAAPRQAPAVAGDHRRFPGHAALGVAMNGTVLWEARPAGRVHDVCGSKTRFPSACASGFKASAFDRWARAPPSGPAAGVSGKLDAATTKKRPRPAARRISTATRRQDAANEHQRKLANLRLRLLPPKEKPARCRRFP